MSKDTAFNAETTLRPKGLKCRSQVRSQVRLQVTGHRPGHRSDHRPQVRSQVTHKNNRTLDKTVLD